MVSALRRLLARVGAKGVTATITWTACTVGHARSLHCNKRIGWDSPTAIYPTQNPAGPFTAQATGCLSGPARPSLVCDTDELNSTL